MNGYKIYCQKENNEFVFEFIFSAAIGFRSLGYDVKYFEDINDVPTYYKNVVVSCIEDTTTFLLKMISDIPKPINIPDSLIKYLNRDIKIMTMGELKKDLTLPIFVKPYDRLKQFESGLITQKDTKKMLFGDISDDINVLTSTPINILSEYRCFVSNGIPIGIKHYMGDFTLFPNIERINFLISKYEKAPASYTLDVGVLDNGNTELIEVNDGWSVDNYGLSPRIYAKFLLRRWIELVDKNKISLHLK